MKNLLRPNRWSSGLAVLLVCLTAGSQPRLGELPNQPATTAQPPIVAGTDASNSPLSVSLAEPKPTFATVPGIATVSPLGSTSDLSGLLASAKVTEEGDGDASRALDEYRRVLREFDRLRPIAAEALFRAGEVARRLGRIEEARAAYSRILREFTDQAAFAGPSLQFVQAISEMTPPPTAANSELWPHPTQPANQPQYGLPEISTRQNPLSGRRTPSVPTDPFSQSAAGTPESPYRASKPKSRTSNADADNLASEIARVEQDLQDRRGEARELDAELRKVERELRATSGADLTKLPTRFVQDAHLLQMLARLEGMQDELVQATDEQRKGLANSLEHQKERTRDYFSNTYLPRLQISHGLLAEERTRLERDIAEIDSRLRDLRGKQAALLEDAAAPTAR